MPNVEPILMRLRDANDADYAFSETLSVSNMRPYLAARSIPWDPQRFARTWREFENYIICHDHDDVGLLRLLEVDGYLEIRDLQLLPKHLGQGLGTWAIAQSVHMARERQIGALRLRVYEENPAQVLYRRLGFEQIALIDRVLHMVRKLD